MYPPLCFLFPSHTHSLHPYDILFFPPFTRCYPILPLSLVRVASNLNTRRYMIKPMVNHSARGTREYIILDRREAYVISEGEEEDIRFAGKRRSGPSVLVQGRRCFEGYIVGFGLVMLGR
ncbi:hypothetical protein HBI56_146150 [Parastagonospora nodorum]|uniref:Uncharacterized protein n=1 Tax=Phaeosphaeria nodorum (strain SN15 / ATCC MYA-4574 / FGSC 10173) TaxID=321614 RepID=A0A7U2IBX7_PHANO|nr:hypothetical protein HBH56_078700 [Parastagonospora nodorum]QRD07044.1 hypothetical protein JI435_423970 [Parastagonospora nodorum SN15]KAH3923462.1 hypothetical protein HBH54_209250 [Parastagonospora nodorum]KAH3952167.1 hypothetical protein HBH53_049420 [Parastagonospora nodorum]KAH3981904.1 hypothetical protein HBH51_045600 [Parastagonospora nodorum]